MAPSGGEKVCSRCRKPAPLDNFTTNRAMPDGKSIYCRSCSSVMGKKQRRRRAIQGSEKHFDHDHKTGKPRGVLCRFCNPMLGLADDNPAVLIAAASYLSRFISESSGVTADAS